MLSVGDFGRCFPRKDVENVRRDSWSVAFFNKSSLPFSNPGAQGPKQKGWKAYLESA